MEAGFKSKHSDLPGQGNMGGARHGTAQATPLVATSHPDGKDRPVLAAPHPEPSAKYTIPKKKKVVLDAHLPDAIVCAGKTDSCRKTLVRRPTTDVTALSSYITWGHDVMVGWSPTPPVSRPRLRLTS